MTDAHIERDAQKQKEFIPPHELFSIPERHLTFEVPLDQINVAHQVRPAEDFGNVTELVSSIRTLGVEQPIRVARWPLDTAKEYVELNNRAYPEREPRDPDALVTLPDGSCFVVIYGHRRLTAAELAELPTIPTKISESPSFREAIQIQTAENLHHRPSPVAFARGLNQAYKLGQAAGMYPNKAIFARESGLSVDQTRDALRFCELPIEIQDLVVQKHLSYATAVELSRLIPAIAYHETAQLRYQLESDLEVQVAQGLLTSEEAKQEVASRSVDTAFLDERVRAMLFDRLLYIQSCKMSARNASKYIGQEVGVLRGRRELPFFDEEARRQHILEGHRAHQKSHGREALASTQAIATAAALFRDRPEVIADLISEPPLQRILGKAAIVIEQAGDVARSDDTKRTAYNASAAIAGLVEVDAIPAEEPSLFGVVTNEVA